MLLLNKTLLRLARGLWQWILAIAAVSFLTLVGTTALAEIVSQFLGSLFEPQVVLSTVKSAVGISRIGIYVSCAACQGTYRIQDGGKGAKHHAKNNLFKGDGTRCGRH